MSTETPVPSVVRQCAELRQQQAEAAKQPMPLKDAIAQAQWCRKTPDGFLDPTVARRTIEALYREVEAQAIPK